MALLSRPPVAMACSATLAYACACMFGYGNPSRLVRARSRALPAVTPLKAMAPLVETEYCETTLPTSNVLAPASDTESEIGAFGWTEFNRSAQRPPHPVTAGWSGTDVCHCVTWSACENNCGGFWRMPA